MGILTYFIGVLVNLILAGTVLFLLHRDDRSVSVGELVVAGVLSIFSWFLFEVITIGLLAVFAVLGISALFEIPAMNRRINLKRTNKHYSIELVDPEEEHERSRLFEYLEDKYDDREN